MEVEIETAMIEQEEIKVTNPFPGLRPFDSDEWLIFFGRDGLSDTLLEKLRATRFVAVVGTSGSGKSSLVRAGLLPALRHGFMTDAGSDWRIAVFRPVNNPIGNLAQALLDSKMVAPDEVEPTSPDRRVEIEETLRRSSLGLIEVVRQAAMSQHENLLIVVDQFEELYRFAPSPEIERPKEEASAFVKLLLEATQQAKLPIYIILTMRSDYLGESAQFWGLPEAINRGQFLIPRMDDDEKREAIEGPIRVFDAKISSPLVNRLLNDVGDDPGQLPIMQHALMRTWDCWKKDRRNSEPLGIRHYDNIGGMTDALSIHAEEAYEALTDDQKIIAEKMFKRLTEKRAGKREGRLPATVGEIKEIILAEEPELLPVIDAFRKEGRSFLMPPAPTPLTSATLIDISHESLIGGWPRLSQWVEDEGDSAKIYGRLVDDALRYPEQANLLTNPALQSALLWHEKEKPNEAWAKRYYTDFGKALVSDRPPPRPEWADASATEYGIATKYLALSEADWQRAKALKDSKRRRKLTFLAIAAVIFLVLALVAVLYAQIAERERSNAVEAQERAVKAQELAIAAQKEAIADKQAAQIQSVIADISAATAENLRRLANAKASEAERERELAESRGKRLNTLAKVGQAFETVLFADAATTPKDVVNAYKSMISYFESSGIHKTAARGTLDGLIVDAILEDNDSSVSDAFPYFREIYMKPSENDPRTLGHVNIKFAQKIIDSRQRETGEAIQFLQAGIKKLDDQKDADEKAAALMQLGEVSGNSDQASHAYSLAAGLFRSKGKIAEEAAAREKLAETYKNQGDPAQALGQYQEALKLFGKVSDQAAMARIGAQLQILAGHP